MNTIRDRFFVLTRLVALLTLVILAAPLFSGLVADDDCCHELICCDYVSCDCNCHMVAGPISVPGYSTLIGAISYLSVPAPFVPIDDFPRGTDRPPRLTA